MILLVVATPVIVWQNQYNIMDWWQLRSYTAPPVVTAFANDTAMSDYGRRLLYVNRPRLDEKEAFNNDCSDRVKPEPDGTYVLGCYDPRKGIFILRVTDQRLEGVEGVTAAHEMLHAAYARLSRSEKNQVNGWLAAAVTRLHDDRINKTLDGYKALDANISNETHSILATEVRDVGPELENYYRRYFTDRSKVVALTEQYDQVFTDIKTKVATYNVKLAELKSAIDTAQNALDSEYLSITAKKNQMDRDLDSQNYPAYNAAVPGYNNAVRRYNGEVSDLQAKIDTYNTLVREFNSVALDQHKLIEAINSKAITPAQ